MRLRTFNHSNDAVKELDIGADSVDYFSFEGTRFEVDGSEVEL